MSRQPDPDHVALRTERAVALKRIAEHQDWPQLVAEMEEMRERRTRALTKGMMRGYPVSVEDQLRFAGFWEGVMAVLKTPGAVEKQVEKLLETVESDAQPNEGE